MKTIIFILSILFSLSCFATKKDSLIQKINAQNLDSTKIKDYNLLIWILITENKLDSAELLSNKAIELANKINYKRGLSSSYQKLGIINYQRANYLKALDYYNICLKYCLELKDNKGLIACYSNMGILYQSQGNFPKALDCALKSLQIREDLKDQYGIATSLGNIGLIYKEQKNYEKALYYYNQSLKIKKEIGDSSLYAHSYNNIAIIYDLKKEYAEALKLHLQALKLNEKYGDNSDIAMSYNNIGMVYLNQKKLQEAQTYFNKSLSVLRNEEDPVAICDVYISLSSIYNLNGDYKTGIKYSDSALKIASEHEIVENLRIIYGDLANSYSAIKDFEKAFKYHVLFKEITDSIFNENNSKLLSDIKTNFEVERKEIELKASAKAEREKLNEISTVEKQKRNNIIIAIVLILIIVIIFSISLYKKFKQTSKQNTIIAKQKFEVETQKQIIEEHQKEINDSINYAKRIQNSFMASENEFNVNLKDYFILFNPKDVVSGDFYWAGNIGEYFYVCVADSTGHGIPGAFMSLLNISLLNEALLSKGLTETNELLDFVRKILILGLKPDESGQGGNDGMDCTLIRLNKSTKQLQVSGANNPLWLIRKNELIQIPVDKMPVGRSPKQNISFTSTEVQLKEDDLIIMFTDGYADQFGGPQGKKFKYKQLSDLLINNSELPFNEQSKILTNKFNEWEGNLEQVDDVCIIGIKI